MLQGYIIIYKNQTKKTKELELLGQLLTSGMLNCYLEDPPLCFRRRGVGFRLFFFLLAKRFA